MKTVAKKSLEQWLTTLETRHFTAIDLGLERINKVYRRCEIDKIAPVIITVAGTNGKGSTVAILSSICQQANYKVAELTSPHILNFNERIKINGRCINDEKIINAFEFIEQHLNGISLSFFEYTALAAMIIFKRENVDVAILEVGLGGRLDAVNVVDSDCAIITTVDIDHTEWLGDNIEDIAYEKAGIMRANKPVIYGDEPCPDSVISHAKNTGAELLLSDARLLKESYELNINGLYQRKNAVTAITALRALSGDLIVTDDAITAGLNTVQLIGRLQTVSHFPEVIVDVSHNHQAAESLNQWLVEHPCKGKTIAVFSVLSSKNVDQWLKVFTDSIDIWCISQVDTERAMPLKELLITLADSADLITSFPDVNDAYVNAQKIAKKQDRIIVFGSFYTVAEVLKNHFNVS